MSKLAAAVKCERSMNEEIKSKDQMKTDGSHPTKAKGIMLQAMITQSYHAYT